MSPIECEQRILKLFKIVYVSVMILFLCSTPPNFFILLDGSGESFLYRFDSEMALEQFPWTGQF